MKLTKVNTMVGVIVGSLSILGSLFIADAYVAKAKDLNFVAMRLEHKIQTDDRRDIVRSMRDIESYYNGSDDVTIMTPIDRKRYQDLQDQLQKINEELEIIRKKYE